MNNQLPRFITFLLSLALFISCIAVAKAAPQVATATNPQTETKPSGKEAKKEGKKEPVGNAGAAGLLHDAYVTLAEADHDYHGHRIEAMKKIEEAGKEVGLVLRGDDRDHEKQGVSDEHLREAESILGRAAGELKGKPLKHVHAAEHEIQIALKIK